jgi:hypothetical protein
VVARESLRRGARRTCHFLTGNRDLLRLSVSASGLASRAVVSGPPHKNRLTVLVWPESRFSQQHVNMFETRTCALERNCGSQTGGPKLRMVKEFLSATARDGNDQNTVQSVSVSICPGNHCVTLLIVSLGTHPTGRCAYRLSVTSTQSTYTLLTKNWSDRWNRS